MNPFNKKPQRPANYVATSAHCLVIDIMMDPGKALGDQNPQTAGLAAIDKILRIRPNQSIVCYSVISDPEVIKSLKKHNVLYLRKAETTAEAALKVIASKATGIYRHDSK